MLPARVIRKAIDFLGIATFLVGHNFLGKFGFFRIGIGLQFPRTKAFPARAR